MKFRIYNNTLNPDVWNPDNTLKNEIRPALLSLVRDFYKDSELKAPVLDVYFMGSLANYNWGEKSDIDLHIIVDFTKISADKELVKSLTHNIKANWNTKHDITIKGYKVEMYIQDVNDVKDPKRAMGIYSVLKNKWIRMPQKTKQPLDVPLIQKLYSEYVIKIKNAVKTNNIEELKKTLDFIYNMREVGLKRDGEYSTENIVFKLLRYKNHLDTLKKTIVKTYDQQHSLKES